jgi:hypothetical protein
MWCVTYTVIESNISTIYIFSVVLAVCGGHLQATDRVKHLYSHSKYDDHNYENRADCDWSIEAQPGRNVHLTFLPLNLKMNRTVAMIMLKSTLVLMPVDLLMAASVEIL